MLIVTLQILLKVHNDPSLCKLQIHAQWAEAATRFNDESTIHQFLKHRIDLEVYECHRITYEHLERQQLSGEPIRDDYLEDALAYAEEKRRSYAKCRGTTVTNSIMDDDPEIAMFLPPGPARRRLETRTITVLLKPPQGEDSGEEDDESEDEDGDDYHTSSMSVTAGSYIDSDKAEYSTEEV